MAGVNSRRIWIGTLAGGVVWNAWSVIVSLAVLGPRYAAMQEQGMFLRQPRYGFFMPAWVVLLFVLAYLCARFYSGVRATWGAGAKTAVLVGMAVGFAAGFPSNFAQATWSPVPRVFPLWWMLVLWVGAVLATLVAGWLYRDA
ncbi:MAG: hypothetical protein ACM3O7_03235 [Acidobacteriota bacterium]